MSKALGHKLATGTAWVMATNIVLRGASVVSTIVLAWLLTPADFGIVAMAGIVTMMMTSMTEVGMNQVLVYHQNADKVFYDTGWTIQALRGLILCVALLGTSGIISDFFNEPKLGPVLQVLSIIFLLNGFSSIGMATVLKQMRFDLEFRYKILPRFMGLACAIGLALWLRSYWAMIIANIVTHSARFSLSYYYAPHWPRPNLVHWKSIFGFSQWVLLREVTANLTKKLDQILLGRWLGSGQLGQYDLAYQISGLPAHELAMPVGRSLFPALAKLQDKPERFRHMLAQTLGAIISVGLPAVCGLFLVAQPLAATFLPSEWVYVGPLIQILCLSGFFSMSFAPCASALTSIGKVRELFFIRLINIFLHAGFLYVGYLYAGFMGVAWGKVVASIPYFLLLFSTLRYYDYFRFKPLLQMIWRPLLASVLMSVCVYSLQQVILLKNWATAFELIGMIVTGIFIYPVALLSLWWLASKPEGTETRILDYVSSFLKSRRLFGFHA